MADNGESVPPRKRRRISFVGSEGAYGWPRWRWALHLWVNGFCQVIDGSVRILTFGYFGTDFTFTHIAKVAQEGCRRNLKASDSGRDKVD